MMDKKVIIDRGAGKISPYEPRDPAEDQKRLAEIRKRIADLKEKNKTRRAKK